jgi:cytosine/uracil/thiamine/allantoin permease
MTNPVWKYDQFRYKDARPRIAYIALVMTPHELASLNSVGHDILQSFAAIMGETFLLSNTSR